MIISASRRTDIPAFYATWFMNRLREGYVLVRNPFNGHDSRVDLTPESADVIVFWSKNPRPLMGHLDDIDAMGHKYYFLFTLNNNPKILEPSVPCFDKLAAAFRELSNRLGSDRVVWRFDPILITSITPEEFIINNFEKIARELRTYTKRVIISFCDYYSKVKANLGKLESQRGIVCKDISGDMPRKQRIASSLADIARANSMEIFSCAEYGDLSSCGLRRSKCIDDELIRSIFGVSVSPAKDKGQRKECGCVPSRDIGAYNTCGHGCVYCYATIKSGMLLHDPESPWLSGRGEAGD
jgi:hypothetical protein